MLMCSVRRLVPSASSSNGVGKPSKSTRLPPEAQNGWREIGGRCYYLEDVSGWDAWSTNDKQDVYVCLVAAFFAGVKTILTCEISWCLGRKLQLPVLPPVHSPFSVV